MGALKEILPALAEQFSSAFRDYLEGAGEFALQQAYELSRKAIADGLGVLDIAAVYQEVLAGALRSVPSAEESARVAKAAAQFFAESLSPFEMTHRSFRESNEALRLSEERYRELFENANDVVFTLDLEGIFTSINRAGEVLSGYARNELPRKNVTDIVVPEYWNLVREMRAPKMATGGPTTYELEILTKDGRHIPVEISTRLIYQEGKPVGVHGIARNITERKQAEEAARRLSEALEEEAKRIAHALHDESGQILASVHIALEETASKLSPASRRELRKVKELLDEIEEQLRRFSHELRPTVLDDLGLVPALESLTQTVTKRTRIPVTLECPPAAKRKRFPAAVETAVYRIVQEALTNVTKHAQATRVSVRLQMKGPLLRCVIRDNGVGFDIKSVASRKGQKGLGLIGIKSRLDALGAGLEIDSAPGRGTELEIRIPLEK